MGYEVRPHHLRLMQHQHRWAERNLGLSWRGSGKTTVRTIVRAIWRFLKDPNDRILLASRSSTNAVAMLSEIKAKARSERFVDVFGDVVGPRWEEAAITVAGRTREAKEPTINTIGIDSAVASMHYDAILFDDLVDEENARTAHMRDKVRTFFYKTLLPTLEPGGELSGSGTRYHHLDMNGHLSENEMAGERTIILPALGGNEEDGYVSAWPERYPVAHLLALRKSMGTILFDCHSEDTEFLTTSGWKLWDDVTETDKLATLHTGTGELRYQLPTTRFAEPYTGPMLHLKSRSVDALVTPNHRFWTKPNRGKDEPAAEWGFATAEELPEIASSRTSRVTLPASLDWKGERPASIHIPDTPRGKVIRHPAPSSYFGDLDLPTAPLLRFLGYFVSEGSTTKDARGTISFAQNPGPIFDDIVRTVRELGFEPRINDKHACHYVAFSHLGLWKWLREKCGTGSGEKRIPRFIMRLATDLGRVFLTALVNGDGTWNERGSAGSFWYSTSSEGLNDDLHELAVRLGLTYTSRRNEYDDEPTWSDHWAGYGRAAETLTFDVRRLETVEYKGRVVCFTTPNGTLVTRRNGRVLIAGNSQYQCDASKMAGGGYVEYDWCQRISSKEVPGDLPRFLGVDLASSLHKKADRFCIVVEAWDKATDHRYIVDGYVGRRPPHEQRKLIKEFYDRHECGRGGVEAVQYQEAAIHDLKHEYPDLNIIPIKTKLGKEARMIRIAAAHEDQRYFYVDGLDWLIEEMVLFPDGDHDDGPDAVDFAHRAATHRERKKRREPKLL